MKFLLPLLVCMLLALSACAPQPAATEIPPTPLPQPSATPTTPPAPTIDAAAACLQGDWVLNNATAESLLVYLSSIPSMTILEGALRISFDDDNFAYHSDDLFLRTSFLEGFLDARAKVLVEGTFTTDGETIQYTKTGAQNELYDWRSVDSNGDIRPFYTTTPVFNFNIAESGTFACNGDSLFLTFDVPNFEDEVFDLTRE